MKKVIEKILRKRINTNNENGWEVIDASEKNLSKLIEEISKELTLNNAVRMFAEREAKELSVELNDLYISVYEGDIYLAVNDEDPYYFNITDVKTIKD